ncbi:poly [ADP-ribose] polymerase 14-like [Orbicella faveolata]|uniref:poly [ADP-ribose] polymerase 14-like n=1 Tax=Orbicella faveolata TaxID=48498 RepID=UPI0009E48C5C|nr:poly [ADP-ribose] polymerase 14-like [Orbicella faveolata]
MSSVTSKNVQDEDPEEMEEKLKKLEEIFSCLPPVLIRRVLNGDDVKGNVAIASQRLQEFQDMENPQDIFKSPPTVKPLTGTVEETSSRGTDQPRNFRGKKRRNRIRSDNDMPKEHEEIQDLRRDSFDDTRAENRGGYQGNRGQNAKQRGGYKGRPRGAPRGGSRGGFAQGQSDYQGFRDNDVGLSQGCGFGGDDIFQPQRGHGNRGGRGHPPKPKPKNRGRGYRGRGSNYQTPGESFQHGDQFCYGDSQPQFNQRQHYPERGGASQQNQRRREVRGRTAAPLQPSDFTDGNAVKRSANNDSLLGPFGGDDPNRRGQGNRGRPRNNGNRGRGRGGMRRAQSLSSVTESGDQNSGQAGSNVKEQSRFERNQLLVCGLSGSTTEECVTNFIEVMSGEEVKEVTLRNDKALVTMANDITDFSRIKTKGEKRGLNSAKVTIKQVPLCTSIVVSGISDNATHDAIELHFESRRNSGGPVESVHFVPKSGRAVVVFEDPKDMERVLARQEEKPHVLNQTQLSIRIYNEFFESEEDDVPDDSAGLAATSDSTEQTQVSQQSKANSQQLHIAVDPDVMEFVTTSVFHDKLKNSLAAKKSEITWKPNNKMAVIVYQGGDDSHSWQSECIDEVQNYFGKFAKHDVQVNKDFWGAVVSQLSTILACLGVDPPLVKLIDDSFVARIVSLSSDVKDYEEKLKSKLEEIYREETRKTYLKKKVPNVPEERLILLKKIKFVEKLQEKNKELEIKLDTEGEEIYFEGPQPQFTEATMKFYKQMSDMVEKTLTLSDRILEVLGSDEGLKKVKCELENNNVEAVFVIDKDAKIVGTSAAHADNAARLVNKLMLEEKVQVDDKSKYLLKSAEWRRLCDEINTETSVRIHRNNWNDTYVAGFRDDVIEVMKKLNTFLESNCIRNERFVCSSQIVRRYVAELCQEDLRSIENQLKDFEVKINKGKGDDDFDISGNKEGLIRARKKLGALIKDTASETFDVKQPGLRKFFDSGKGDRLVKSVEKDHSCAIQVKNFGQRWDDSRSQAAAVDSASSGSDDDDSDVDDEGDDDAAVSDSDASTLVMTQGHKISWKPGNIEMEKVDVLVSSVGASCQAIVNAGVPAMTNPNVGDITVNSGLPLTKQVIHTNCCQWQGGQGDVTLRAIVQKSLQKGEELGARSIAFPVIGTGKLGFPRDAASRIMLEETISFCQNNPYSNVQDIRFIVFQGDQALTAAFKQEMDKLKSKFRPAYTMRGLLSSIRSRFRRRVPLSSGGVHIEVLQGDLCQETTDAIVNIASKDMNMETAGALSKAVKLASGPQVEAECNQLGQQSGGSAVITSGGNLKAHHIIHMIPDSATKDHLQQCVERCLRLAETKGLQSISIPAIGTGAFGLSAVDSASLIFQALGNFSGSFNNIRKVRIVVFQPQMLQSFQQENQRHFSYSSGGTAAPIGKDHRFSVEVINGDLTQERTDAIMNINSADMNMNNAGDLSKAIARASGQQVQQECSQLGKQSAGSAVMTSGGNLQVSHIIHIIPGSSDKQHLQQCLEEGLRVADAHNLRSISIPSVGTGGYGLAAADSAQVTFQALNNFNGSCKSVRKVRVVVFQAQMIHEFLQEQRRDSMQDVDEEESDSSSDETDAGQPRMRVKSPIKQASLDHSVRICVIGKKKAGVEKAVESLKKGFSEACTTEKVESEVISQLSHKQIVSLRRKAEDRDVKLVVEADVDRIVVRGQPAEVSGMVGEIWKEISERTKKTQEEEQAQLVAMNIEWSYEIHGSKMNFGRKANAKIEMASSKDKPIVQVSLRGDQFVIDLKAKTGRAQRTGEQITLTRKVKGAEEGIALPKHWTPMPNANMTVHLVPLSRSSTEYQDVQRKFQATAGAVSIQKIERIQNPHLYQSYTVRKQKMDKDIGGNSERQLFHGTDSKNVSHINTQGFNRSFCGAHGVAFGRGVYFARDAQYSLGYARGGVGGRHMYLARVLVGQYCVGNSSMIVPPPKNHSRPEILYESVVNNQGNPSIFVVFYDNQCYPEYLITMQ